ncbi:MAG: HlyD family type I secretion periplasmic adaptor subunit [Pseudomonadales bacterium]|nr:HlyD family type I secretion periplasmic adaptor subunit [Pseudomonadales bacterium]
MAKHQDIAFMPDTHAVEIEAVPLTYHLILWVSAIFLITAVVWANLAEIDEVARADGRVIPSSQVQIIQNLEGGILTEVLVRPGEFVRKDQTLIRLDDTRFASSYNEGRLSSQALEARIARLQAEVSGQAFEVPANSPAAQAGLFEQERHLYERRQEELTSSVDILTQQLSQHRQTLAELKAEEQKLIRNAELARKELALTEPLVETGAVSQVELLRLQVAVNESLGQLEVIQLTIPKAESVIVEAEKKINERRQQFVREAQSELNDARTELNRLSISNLALEDRVNRTDVRSPVDGTVKQVLVNTVGAVVQPGMDIIEIVPANDTLLIEARIRPSDIAFIHPGQKATVKLTAYDFAIYGGLDAVLEHISADTITDERGEHYFQIKVRTTRTYLGREDNQLPIIPGMIATVDILTGQKTVMDYILKPLKRAQAAAMSER